MKNQNLSHLNEDNRPQMVDITEKTTTSRQATAEAHVVFEAEIWQALMNSGFATKKGSIIDTAQIAGTMAVKKTPETIPFCHQIPIEKCSFDCNPDNNKATIVIRCTVGTTARTGVEMEALTGVSAAALTVYDMTKSLGHGIRIEGIQVLQKSGGKSDFQK